MLKISKLTDYAVVLVTTVAHEQRAWSATELAAETNLPATTVAKVLKVLSRGGILESQRGKLGGYALARSAKLISVLDVLEAMDGPLCLTECSAKNESPCAIEGACCVRGHWRRINDTVRKSLEGLSIADMMVPLPRAGSTGGAKLLRIARRA